MSTIVTLRIEGLSCMGCVTTVRKALEDVPDTSDVKVDLESGSASMKFKGDVQIVMDAVSQTGKKAALISSQKETNQIRLKVEGMSCVGCVALVSSALSKLEGANDVKVELESGVASLAFDGNVEDALKAVHETGKTASAL